MLVRSLNYFDTSSRNVVEKENWNIPANSFSLLSFPSLFREEERSLRESEEADVTTGKAPPPPPPRVIIPSEEGEKRRRRTA